MRDLIFFQLPGKRGEGPKGWAIQSKLNIMIWLGLHKHKKDYLKDAPKGYEPVRFSPSQRMFLKFAEQIEIEYTYFLGVYIVKPCVRT